jgi:hypothetical protein
MIENPSPNMNWHRLFGLTVQDFFAHSPYDVESEVDLSLKQQRLDLVVIHKRPGTFDRPLPDGLEDLVEYNLITFKSYQESFDDWAVHELIGHYVNYRKQKSPSLNQLLPIEGFKLFGVAARFPTNLSKEVSFRELKPGVFDFDWGTQTIRLLVVRDLPLESKNCLLHLFSANEDRVKYAAENYTKQNEETSTILDRLLLQYSEEGIKMPYTIENFKEDLLDEMLAKPEFRRRKIALFTPEERFEGLDPKPLLEGLDPKQRLEGLDPKQRLEGLDPEVIQKYLDELKSKQAKPD